MRISQPSVLALAEVFLIGYISNNIGYNNRISIIALRYLGRLIVQGRFFTLVIFGNKDSYVTSVRKKDVFYCLTPRIKN
jgi:hypothetical protein